MGNTPHGIFIKRTRLVPIALFLLFAGSLLAVRFSLWGAEEIGKRHVSSAIFCFMAAICGLSLGILSTVLLRFNRKAKLAVERDTLVIRHAWSEEQVLPFENIESVEVSGHTLTLSSNGQTISVSGLLNAVEMGNFIRRHIPKRTKSVDWEAERKRGLLCRKKYHRSLILTAAACVWMFALIGLCVWLTNGKELDEFSRREDVIFLIFAAAEILTVCAGILLAGTAGKRLTQYRESLRRLHATLARLHRRDELEKYDGLITVKYFDGGVYRIAVFSPREGRYAYMLERFDMRSAHWSFRYERAMEFQTLSELYEALKDTFDDVWFEEE